MKPLPHRYDVQLTGGPAGYATLSAPGLPELKSAPPLDYDGPGDAWSPEHLLLAAVETCFLFTLRAVAKASKIEFTTLELSQRTAYAHTRRQPPPLGWTSYSFSRLGCRVRSLEAIRPSSIRYTRSKPVSIRSS